VLLLNYVKLYWTDVLHKR